MNSSYIDFVIMSVVFWSLFALFAWLGFYGAKWRRGDLSKMAEWALAGRRLGVILAFFLLGADWFTAYSFLAVPSAVYATGAYGFFAVAYQTMVFAFALTFMPRLWVLSREKGYITAADFLKDRFGSRALSISFAVVGIVAILPYIALQIVGMQVVLATMFLTVLPPQQATLAQDIALTIAFIILAAFTYTSGLRGAALGAVLKDVVIWVTFFATLAVVLLNAGGYGNIFSRVPNPNYLRLSPQLYWAFTTSMLGAVLTAYLWPHNTNSALSAESPKKLKTSLALGPLYAVPLALLDILVLAVYLSPDAQRFISSFPPSVRGLYTIPALWIVYFPSWFVGLALVGVFVGGLVPAAVMALSQANLLIRNIVKEFTDLPEHSETRLAKIASVIFKFLALGFVFTVAPTYAIQFYFVGAALLVQLFPAVFIGLYSRWPRSEALLAGMYVGIALSIYMILAANRFGMITTTLWATPLGPMYLGILALLANLLIVVLLTFTLNIIKKT